jgi:hypothetical protein
MLAMIVRGALGVMILLRYAVLWPGHRVPGWGCIRERGAAAHVRAARMVGHAVITLAAMDVPIACSLPAAAARSQLGEWRDLLSVAITETSRVSATEVSLRLRDDLTQLPAIVRLAQREKACCPFFGFGIRIDADTIALHVSVPAEASSILDGFTSLAPDPGRS